MIYQNIRVAIPQGKKYKPRILHGITYLYYRENSYRVNGKLKHNEYSLGRMAIDAEHGIEYLIPNEKYYEHFNLDKPIGEVLSKRGRPRKTGQTEHRSVISEDSAIYSCYSVAVMHLAKESKLHDILVDSFGETVAHNTLAMAMFFAAGCPYGISAIEQFIQKNRCFSVERIEKSCIADHLQSIKPHDIEKFYKSWIHETSENGSICYDMSSISSCSKNLSSEQIGYNRDNDKLMQVNVGMFCTQTAAIPLCMSTYKGSISDVCNFADVIENARFCGIDINKTTFVVDGGLELEKTLSSEIVKNNSFVVGVPFALDKRSRNCIENWDRNSSDTRIFAFNNDIIEAKEESIFCGSAKYRLFVYFSESRRANELAAIKHNINEMSAKIESKKMSFSDSFLSELLPLFIINQAQDGETNYEIDVQEYRNLTAKYGYFAIYCSDDSIDIKEALKLYRKKYVLEKFFGIFKNDIFNENLYLDTNQSLAGKFFIVMLAFVIRKLIENKLQDVMNLLDVEYGEVVASLTDIKCKNHNNEWIFNRKMTKEESAYMQAMGIPVGVLGK